MSADADARQAVRESVALARRADELGYTRFWLAEHHSMPGVASSAPAVLIGAVADATTAIRVGSGGVMLPNHAPLVVAEQFGTLAALHPGRVDLGLGRAPGSDPLTASALRRSGDLRADDFPQHLGELGYFLADEWPDGHPYKGITAVPRPPEPLPIWLLGSSPYSAKLAGSLGLPFAFAHHFSSANTLAAMEQYRRSFQPGRVLDEPYAMVTVHVASAPTDDEAQRIALPGGLSLLQLRQGRPGPLPTLEQAAAYPWTDEEREFVASRWDGQAVGDPDTVRTALAHLLEATHADELMITTLLHPADRIHALELVHDLFGGFERGLGQV